MNVNLALVKQAFWKMNTGDMEKSAVVPPMDPSGMPMGAGPPMDPAMGGAPPMDPAAAGGPPPPPGGAGGAPAPPPGIVGDPAIQQIVQQVIQATLAQTGGGMGGGGGKGKGGAGKLDPLLLHAELGYIRKLLTHLYQQMGLELPPDILDTPAQVSAEMETGQVPPGGVAQPMGAPAGPAPGGPMPMGPPPGGEPKMATELSDRGIWGIVSPPKPESPQADSVVDFCQRWLNKR
jgi:hypothetical protein